MPHSGSPIDYTNLCRSDVLLMLPRLGALPPVLLRRDHSTRTEACTRGSPGRSGCEVVVEAAVIGIDGRKRRELVCERRRSWEGRSCCRSCCDRVGRERSRSDPTNWTLACQHSDGLAAARDAVRSELTLCARARAGCTTTACRSRCCACPLPLFFLLHRSDLLDVHLCAPW